MTGAEVRPGPVDVEAVVVTWNTRDLMVDCLRSLAAHPPAGRPFRVTVVDNGSSDGEAETVARDWPDVHLIRNPTNEGFTRANNRAIRESTAAYLLLINADARLTAGCLDEMLECLESHPRAGAVGPRLVYGDGAWQRWTAGAAPSLGSALVHHLALDRIVPALDRRGLYLGRDLRRPFQPGWVSSACILVRRSALDEVGLLDERIFTYMDDVDICQRLRDGGWQVWYWPAAESVHLMGQSVRRQTGNVSPAAVRSFHRYFRSRHGAVATALLRLVEAFGFGARAAAYRLLLLARRDPRLRDGARAHWTYFKLALEAGHDV